MVITEMYLYYMAKGTGDFFFLFGYETCVPFKSNRHLGARLIIFLILFYRRGRRGNSTVNECSSSHVAGYNI